MSSSLTRMIMFPLIIYPLTYSEFNSSDLFAYIKGMSMIYNAAKNIVDQSRDLKALVKSTREGLSFNMQRSVMKPLPNESKSLDGLNIHYAALDEIHEQRDRNMYDVLRQGMKARKQPLIGSPLCLN